LGKEKKHTHTQQLIFVGFKKGMKFIVIQKYSRMRYTVIAKDKRSAMVGIF